MKTVAASDEKRDQARKALLHRLVTQSTETTLFTLRDWTRDGLYAEQCQVSECASHPLRASVLNTTST